MGRPEARAQNDDGDHLVAVGDRCGDSDVGPEDAGGLGASQRRAQKRFAVCHGSAVDKVAGAVVDRCSDLAAVDPECFHHRLVAA